MSFEPGDRIGPYEILARLGAGGMGIVYRARDSRLHREVAIKVLSEEGARDRDRLRRFLAEAKAASALNHPNILTVHEIGESDSGPYIVTELVAGRTLRELVLEGPLPPIRVLDVAIQIADGIGKAHEAGIVHRDLKPENLMITGDGLAKILDFGLVKLLAGEGPLSAGTSDGSATATGMIVGTAGYISPEQLKGQPADGRSDVFALGVVIYEMASGENPFRRETPAETFSAILRDRPAPLSDGRPDLPRELSLLLERALEKEPERRFASARLLAAELRRLRSAIERPPSPSDAVSRAAPSRRRAVALAGAALAVLSIAGIALWISRESPREPVPPVLQPGRMAVAVLPIQDQTGDPELRRSGIGRILTDAFVQILADFSDLHVVSPLRLDGVARSLGRNLEEAGSDLHLARAVSEGAEATAMLAGSLSLLGETYVLNTTLTELPSETLIGTFRAESRNPEQLLVELTSGISESIHQRLGARSSTSPHGVGRVATTSLEAYSRFVRGYDLQAEGRWSEAIAELGEALEIDPEMGLAWSFLACSYSFAGDDTKARAAQRKAEEFLDRVNRKERRWIELNGIWVTTGSGPLYRKAAGEYVAEFPDDREGYFYLGLGAEYLDGDCATALAHYETAYRLTPNYYPISKAIVDCALKLGERRKAIESLERYLSLRMVPEHGRVQAEARLRRLREGTEPLPR